MLYLFPAEVLSNGKLFRQLLHFQKPGPPMQMFWIEESLKTGRAQFQMCQAQKKFFVIYASWDLIEASVIV